MQRASYALFSSFRAGKSSSDDETPSTNASSSVAALPNGGASGTSKTRPLECSDDEGIIEVLDKKRRQLDEEIDRFKTEKEREFKDFERELRASRAKKTKGKENRSDNGQRNGRNGSSRDRLDTVSKRQSHVGNGLAELSSSTSPIRSRTSPISELTGSLTKLDTNGARRTTSDSGDGDASRTVKGKEEQPRENAVQEPSTPSVYNRDADFHGVFTQSFLPLINGDDDRNSRSVSQKRPSGSKEAPLEVVKAVVGPALHGLTPSPSSSYPPHSTAPPALALPSGLVSNSISKTSSRSSFSSTSLPSALRTPANAKDKNGKTTDKKSRSPKRVLFQLATAIVQPSSSYEEPAPTATDHTVHNQSSPIQTTSVKKGVNMSKNEKGMSAEDAHNISEKPRVSTHHSNLHAKVEDEADEEISPIAPSSPPSSNAKSPSNIYDPPTVSEKEASSYFDLAMNKSTKIRSPPPPQTGSGSSSPVDEASDPVFNMEDDDYTPKANTDEDNSLDEEFPEVDECPATIYATSPEGAHSSSLPIDIIRRPRRH